MMKRQSSKLSAEDMVNLAAIMLCVDQAKVVAANAVSWRAPLVSPRQSRSTGTRRGCLPDLARLTKGTDHE
jgi:hypothetical protein